MNMIYVNDVKVLDEGIRHYTCCIVNCGYISMDRE